MPNALKLAFPAEQVGRQRDESRCEIHIELHPDNDDNLVLIVRDTGIGLPEEVDFQHAETLGMRLIGMFIRQLKATVDIDRRGGTMFTITFAK